MARCRKCFYRVGRNGCSSPTDIYVERFCNWRNRDNNCREYLPRVELTDRLKILEGETGIVSEVILNTTIVVLNAGNYR
jgi:hypothetical protein